MTAMINLGKCIVLILCFGTVDWLVSAEPGLRELPSREWLLEQYEPVKPDESEEAGRPSYLYDEYLSIPEVRKWLIAHEYEDLYCHYLLADGGSDAPRLFIARIMYEDLSHFDDNLQTAPFLPEERLLIDGFEARNTAEWALRHEMDGHTRYLYSYSVMFHQSYRDHLRGRLPNWVQGLLDDKQDLADDPLHHSPIYIPRRRDGEKGGLNGLFERNLTGDDWQVMRSALRDFDPKRQEAFYARILDQDDLGKEEFLLGLFPFSSTQAFHRLPPSMRLFHLDLMYLGYIWDRGEIVLGDQLQQQLQTEREAEFPDFSQPLKHELGWYLRDGWPVPPITRVVEAMDNGLVDFSDSRTMAVGLAATWHSFAHYVHEGAEEWLDYATMPGARFLLAALESDDLSLAWRFRAERLAMVVARRLRWSRSEFPDHRGHEVDGLEDALESYLHPENGAYELFETFLLEPHIHRKFSVSQVISLINKRLELLVGESSDGTHGSVAHLSIAPSHRLVASGRPRAGIFFTFESIDFEGNISNEALKVRLQEIDRSYIFEIIIYDLREYWGEMLANDDIGRKQMLKWGRDYPELEELIREIIE